LHAVRVKRLQLSQVIQFEQDITASVFAA
jgi:hypothetical protein